jgi:hypothetical protein
MVDITKKWDGIMSLKHMQRTSATESESLAQLSPDTCTHAHTFCLCLSLSLSRSRSQPLRNILTRCTLSIVRYFLDDRMVYSLYCLHPIYVMIFHTRQSTQQIFQNKAI